MCVFTGYCSDAIYQISHLRLLLPVHEFEKRFLCSLRSSRRRYGTIWQMWRKRKKNHFMRVIICQPLCKSKKQFRPSFLSVKAVGSSRGCAFVTATGMWLEGESEDRLELRGWWRGCVRFQIQDLTYPPALADGGCSWQARSRVADDITQWGGTWGATCCSVTAYRHIKYLFVTSGIAQNLNNAITKTSHGIYIEAYCKSVMETLCYRMWFVGQMTSLLQVEMCIAIGQCWNIFDRPVEGKI